MNRNRINLILDIVSLVAMAGAVMMLLVFFNLSVVHNYYQIPFLAPLAALAAVVLVGCDGCHPEIHPSMPDAAPAAP